MINGLVGPILSKAGPPYLVNNKVPRFANRFNVPIIAPLMSEGIVLKNNTSMLDDYIADAIMMQEHKKYEIKVSGFLIKRNDVKTMALNTNETGTVMCVPTLSDIIPRTGRTKAVPNRAISVIF